VQNPHLNAAASSLLQFLEEAGIPTSGSRARPERCLDVNIFEVCGRDPDTRLRGPYATFDYLVNMLPISHQSNYCGSTIRTLRRRTG
jgi:hypothetical protein